MDVVTREDVLEANHATFSEPLPIFLKVHSRAEDLKG